jgi:hypothetical protein
MLRFPGLLLVNVPIKSRNSSLQLETRTIPRLVFFVARKEHQFTSSFPATSKKSIILSFGSMTSNASSPIRPAILIISENGTKLLPATRSKFLNIAMQLKEKKFGSMLILFAKHRATVPDKCSYLLGDSNGPKSA